MIVGQLTHVILHNTTKLTRITAFIKTESERMKYLKSVIFPDASNDVGVDDGDAGVLEEVRDGALPGRDPAR